MAAGGGGVASGGVGGVVGKATTAIMAADAEGGGGAVPRGRAAERPVRRRGPDRKDGRCCVTVVTSGSVDGVGWWWQT